MRFAKNFYLEDHIIQFLIGLNEKNYAIKTQVLLMEPLPSINKIYFMIVQEESNNIYLLPKLDVIYVTKDSNTMINAYDTRKRNDHVKNNRYKKDICMYTHCNRTGKKQV